MRIVRVYLMFCQLIKNQLITALHFSKSRGSDTVSVRPRPSAPIKRDFLSLVFLLSEKLIIGISFYISHYLYSSSILFTYSLSNALYNFFINSSSHMTFSEPKFLAIHSKYSDISAVSIRVLRILI